MKPNNSCGGFTLYSVFVLLLRIVRKMQWFATTHSEPLLRFPEGSQHLSASEGWYAEGLSSPRLERISLLPASFHQPSNNLASGDYGNCASLLHESLGMSVVRNVVNNFLNRI